MIGATFRLRFIKAEDVDFYAVEFRKQDCEIVGDRPQLQDPSAGWQVGKPREGFQKPSGVHFDILFSLVMSVDIFFKKIETKEIPLNFLGFLWPRVLGHSFQNI